MSALPPKVAVTAVLCLVFAGAFAQETLDQMPRYDRYERLRREISSSVTGGSVSPVWAEDGKSLVYQKDSKAVRLDLATLKEEPTTSSNLAPRESNRRGARGAPERGRQFDSATSPDGKLKAIAHDRNVFITSADGKNEIAITTEGSAANRIKYGVASWVYGEELGVREAMWWSPDGTKLAYYRFDETSVKDYFLGLNQTSVQDALDQEAYPKAGANNPKVGLLVYDVATHKSVEIQTSFGDSTLGEYIYDVKWAPDGSSLLFNRTNRKQNLMQLCAAEGTTGAAHVIVEEKQPQSWAENHPEVVFLKDKHRFLWSSEKTGFKNYYLYDLNGSELGQVTKNQFDAIKVLRVDEGNGYVYYTSYGDSMPYHRQFHCAKLDGTSDVCLTDPKLDHTISLSPEGDYYVDVSASSDQASQSKLCDISGKVLATLSTADTLKFETLKLKKTEVFTFTAADGRTVLYGTIQFPSDFDAKRKYPVLLSVYGGPESGGIQGGFSTPNPITELGFLVVNIAGRGTTGRGKAFRDAVYQKLGQVEIDDQAAGINSLGSRSYVDLRRVGVFGTSYGGYSTIMCLLRYPDLFKVGCSSSPVTDWKNYDSIYTERYNGLPEESDNLKGYGAGSAMTYARNLKGWLMLYYGTADNNVHPSNTIQLVQTLENSGKRYDLQVGPDRGHTQMNSTRMWEYFVQHLILEQPKGDPLKTVMDRRQRARAKARETAG